MTSPRESTRPPGRGYGQVAAATETPAVIPLAGPKAEFKSDPTYMIDLTEPSSRPHRAKYLPGTRPSRTFRTPAPGRRATPVGRRPLPSWTRSAAGGRSSPGRCPRGRRWPVGPLGCTPGRGGPVEGCGQSGATPTSARDRPLPSAGAPGAADGSAPVDAEAPTDEAAAGGFESSVFAAFGLQAASEVTRKTAAMGARRRTATAVLQGQGPMPPRDPQSGVTGGHMCWSSPSIARRCIGFEVRSPPDWGQRGTGH